MATRVIESIAKLRAAVATARQQGLSVGFVPTMGALHAGHGSLIAAARRDCGFLVISIFVNPLQFDRKDDLEKYPRTLDADLALCSRLGADIVFAPPVAEIYPAPQVCIIHVGSVGEHLCGRYRPGHFDGVATVVMKLFQIVVADRAYFGEKDAQQLAVIRHLVRDFNVTVAIAAVATVRESDGLAISSRNARLNSAERRLAPALYRMLREAERLIGAGAVDAAAVRSEAARLLPADPQLRLEYLDIVDPEDIQPVERVDGPVLVAGALWVGSTRLIDNVRVVTK